MGREFDSRRLHLTVTDSMKQIPLTQGKVALVSNCDYTFLSQWNWYYHRDHKGIGGYAKRAIKIPTSQTISMHGIIAKRKGINGRVDHRNRNKLDNRRCNLRPATNVQNRVNCDLRATNTSGFTGVCWHRAASKWVAFIGVNKKKKYLGLFPRTEVGKKAAARVYNKAALKYFGEYACLNKVD